MSRLDGDGPFDLGQRMKDGAGKKGYGVLVSGYRGLLSSACM